MKRREKTVGLRQGGSRVLDIPLRLLHPDPHQPRTEFDPEDLAELARSIEAQGLQQEPKVNPAYVEGGEQHYYLKAGERRLRAHQLLHKETMQCIVEDKSYDGARNVERRLMQAAENSSRSPHTHSEIIAVMEDVVRDELSTRSEHKHGAIEIAMGRVANSFGKSREWALNYYTLTHLHPELRAMLDSKDDEERLSFAVSLALARAPVARQQELLDQAKPLKAKGGHVLMQRFIVRQARVFREEGGIKTRLRKLSDDKAVLVNTVGRLYRQALSFVAERRSKEHAELLGMIVGQMSATEVDPLLHELNEALITFTQLRDLLTARREVVYRGLKVVRRQ